MLPSVRKELQPGPLAMEVSERGAERRLRWNRRLLFVDPDTQRFNDRFAVLEASDESLRGGVTVEFALPLDGEKPGNRPHAIKGDLVSGARGFGQAAPTVAPASGPLTAGALHESRDVRAVTLHGPHEIFAQEPAHAVRIPLRRIEEADPKGVGPTPHRALPDAVGRIAVEHRNAGRVGRQQPGRSCLRLDHFRHRRQRVDRDRDGAAQCLRRDVHARARPAKALPLDGLMLKVLVGE